MRDRATIGRFSGSVKRADRCHFLTSCTDFSSLTTLIPESCLSVLLHNPSSYLRVFFLLTQARQSFLPVSVSVPFTTIR